MKSGVTIGTRLLLYIGGLVAIILVIGTMTGLAIAQLDAAVASVNQKWLNATRVMDRLGVEVAGFRFAELDRALARASGTAATLPPRADPPDEASARGEPVAALLHEYELLVGAHQPHADVAAFSTAWNDYLMIHAAWLRADVYRNAAGLAGAKGSLDWRYKGVDEALRQLKAASYRAATTDVGQAVQAAASLNRLVSLSFAAAAILALLLVLHIRQRIVRPLRSITAALTRLAEGNTGFTIPELQRNDEIGEMAKAFEVFRANAAELELAHTRTRAAQEIADLLARQDALTSLPNRRVFALELAEALSRARQSGSACALLIVDLDRFKPVNDVQGHGTGDRVLCEVARRLEALPAERKLVARLGGDEFAVILDADEDTVVAEAAAIAEHVVSSLRVPMVFDDLRIEIGASVGIACWPSAGNGSDDMIHAADLAMYRAKHEGRDRFCFFEPSMDRDWREQTMLDEGLRLAIDAGEIEPHYQPLLDLSSENIRGFEVLARWTHPVHGTVAPDRFIAMAERLGLIAPLMTGLMRRAFRDAAAWGDVRLAVNVSPFQLVEPTFPQQVLGILEEEGFPPTRLEIEITESALIKDLDVAKSALSALQAHGILVSLDDFGTGYSSLYHLRNLKFDKIKIDKSFVQSLHEDGESAKIVDAVLSLARSLGMPVVAEGIENRAAAAHLLQRGCEYGQGYLFSRAVRPEVVERMLSDQELKLSA